MKKPHIIALLILLGGLIYLHFGMGLMGQEQQVTAEINDEGFSPETISIPMGTTVTWVNSGESLHWPASNFHPQHNLYPEGGGCLGSALDACTRLKKGESFSFKFNEKGIWPMHDHLFPGHTMVVRVGQEEEKKAVLSYKEVTPEKFRQMEYTSQLSLFKEFANDNPALAWDFLKESYMVDGKVVGNAHEFSHIVGNTLYKKQGLEGIKVCDITFAYGCMHGVTEALFAKVGPEGVKDAEKKCLEFFPPQESIDYTGCIHGMGHGLFGYSGGNVNTALNNCDQLTSYYQTYCHDGVFMENSNEAPNRTFDPKDPWKLCTDLEERYHPTCAKYQSQIFLHSPGNILETAGKYCDLGPATVLRETCFRSMGYHVAQMNLGNVENIVAECARMPNTFGKGTCMRGGAVETVFQQYRDWETASKDICGRIIGMGQESCFQEVQNRIDNAKK